MADVDKVIITCAVTGVLTNPKQHPVPVTPAEMASPYSRSQQFFGPDDRFLHPQG